MYSKIDLRGVELETVFGIYCPYIFDESVRCAHVDDRFAVRKINYLCVCDVDRPAPQDMKKPKRMNIVEFMHDRKLQENYHGVRLQHSIAGVEGW